MPEVGLKGATLMPRRGLTPIKEILKMREIKDYSLYLIITEEYGKGRGAVEIAKEAIAAGVDIIQMREKNKTRAELLSLGKELSALCRSKGVTFIVNDDPIIAKEVSADGVHLGQEDIINTPVSKARTILGPDKIIGLSTGSLSQVMAANKEDIDYIAYGPVFHTEIKDKCVGTNSIGMVLKAAAKPVIFIGGINMSNIDELLTRGVKNISLIRGILQAEDIKTATRNFRKRIDEFKRVDSSLRSE